MLVAFHIARLLLFAILGYQTPRLTTVVPPSPPWNAATGNAVLATAQLDDKGAVTDVCLLQGVTPFTEEAKRSISQWRFAPAQSDGKAVASEVTVVMVFSPHSFVDADTPGPALGFTPALPQGDHPVLPIYLFAPGVPLLSFMNPPGVVIFDLELNESGSIGQMRLINEVPTLTERARQAVKQWDFAAAVNKGKTVRSTVIVAISFVTPIVTQ